MKLSESVQPWVFDADKTMGLELELFRRKDFSPVQRYLEETFPEGHSRIKLRYVSLAAKVASDGAGQYIDTPLRELSGLSEVQRGVVEDYHRALMTNARLLMAEQQGVLQQAYLLGVWPDRSGRPRLTPFLPYHITEVEFDDPFARAAGDLRGASKVVLGMPLRSDTTSTQSHWMMRIVLTRDEAYCVMPGQDGKLGIFHPSGRNPLGRVPVVGMRREEPEGRYLPRVAQDVHSCNIGLVLALSDAEAIQRYSAIDSVLVMGDDAVKMPRKMPLVPGQMIPLVGDVRVQVVHQQPATDRYLQAVAMTMKFLTQFRNLRPQGYEASIITGPAAAIDREGFLEERRRQELRCERLEQDLLDLIIDVHNASATALKLTPGARVRMHYRYVRPRENVLQEAQSLAVLNSLGLWSSVEEVAKSEGVTHDEAIDLIEKRLTVWAKVLPAPAGPTPGLDRTAPTAPGKPGRPSALDQEPPEEGPT